MFRALGNGFANLKTAVVSGNVHVLFSMITDFVGAGQLKVTIGSLPDEALLEIFAFYQQGADYNQEEWIALVHVCRGWRYIVFASPLRLDLRLRVRGKIHKREMLDIWPALPIAISPYTSRLTRVPKITENVITALGYRDRVCRIALWYFTVPGRKLGRFLEMMQHPFPALTCLALWDWLNDDEEAVVISDSFLGGSAPLLQSLYLTHIAFPALPKLLLSANHLVDLHLRDIAHAGYISPEVMVASLSSMTKLQYLGLAFGSPHSRPSRASQRPPPMIRTTLPALTRFRFKGVSEYVEDFVARIDAPLLCNIYISFFNQLVFDIPQFSHIINRVESFNRLNATISFSSNGASVELSSETHDRLLLEISCRQADWQLSSVVQFCGMSLHPVATSENLTVTIDSGNPRHLGRFDIEHSQWEELLYPFTNVKNLYLAEDVGLHITTALQGLVGESVTQVLPALQRLFITGLEPTQEVAESFTAARQCLGRPVAIRWWEEGRKAEYRFDESEQKLDSEWESDLEVDD